MSAREEFEAQRKRRVTLQQQIEATKATADKIRADIQKSAISSAAIKKSKAEIDASIKRLESAQKVKLNIEQTKKAIEETKDRIKAATIKLPKAATVPTKRRKLIVEVANKLHKDASFKTNVQLKADIEKYGSLSAARAHSKPTLKEARARLGLIFIEPIIGGIQEATLGIRTRQDSAGRPETAGLRILGALATPTVADFAFGWVLAKTGATKAGRGLLKKLDKSIQNIADPFKFPTPATTKALDELWNFEVGLTQARRLNQATEDIGLSLIEQQRLSKAFKKALDTELPLTTKRSSFKFLSNIIDDLEIDLATRQRLSQRVKKIIALEPELPIMTEKFKEDALTSLRRTVKRNPSILDNIEGISEFYRKNPAKFDIKNPASGGIAVPEEVFILQNIADDFSLDVDDLIPLIEKNPDLFADGALITALIPGLSIDDARKLLNETTSLPSDQVDDAVERYREGLITIPRLGQAPGQTPIEDTPPFEDDEPDIVIPILDTPPGEIPVPDDPRPILDIPPPPQPPDEPPPIIPPPITPPIILSKKDRKKRNTLNLRLFRGAKSMFRVTFLFTKSMSEVIPVEARSFVEAVNKAQRGRKRRKKQPKLIDIVKTS